MENESIRVLIVDDDTSILQLVTHHLNKEFGDMLSVSATPNPQQAMGLAAIQPVDICITDLDMPALNGFGLLKSVKRLNTFTEVVILTAFPSENAIRSAFKLGASEYLLKPINSDLLKSTIHFLVSRIQRYKREIVVGT